MPYADPEKNRAYQKQYQREYARRKRAEKRAAEGREKFQRCTVHPYTGPGKCETCCKDYQVKWRQDNAEASKAQQREYRLANLEARRENSRKWGAANAERKREYMRKWQQDNPEAVRVIANRRRARKANVFTIDFTVEQLAAKWAYWGNLCWVCGADAKETDHVKPISKGGAHMLANLRPICKSCNCRKSDRWPYVP